MCLSYEVPWLMGIAAVPKRHTGERQAPICRPPGSGQGLGTGALT
jgi:hypothetical protein